MTLEIKITNDIKTVTKNASERNEKIIFFVEKMQKKGEIYFRSNFDNLESVDSLLIPLLY